MEIELASNVAFEAVSQVIFDEQRDLEPFDRLYLQTWFVRHGIDKTKEYEQLLEDLLDYVRSGEPTAFLLNLASGHPTFIDWFGRPLVGKEQVENIIGELKRMVPFDPKPAVPSWIDEAEHYLQPLGMADRLQLIVGEPYPKPQGPIHYVISQYASHAYNIYPDVVAHFRKNNLKWYIAGFGHEAGHLLTWEMCRAPEVRELCDNDRTKGFAELLAILCNKLLLDAYEISCEEVFTEYSGWDEYMYEKNPGKPLFEALISEITLGSYSSLRDECIRILKGFQ